MLDLGFFIDATWALAEAEIPLYPAENSTRRVRTHLCALPLSKL